MCFLSEGNPYWRVALLYLPILALINTVVGEHFLYVTVYINYLFFGIHKNMFTAMEAANIK